MDEFFFKDFFKAQSSKKDLQTILKSNVLFLTLKPSEIKYLSEFVYERVYEEGEVIFHQNERGLGVYVIVEGHVAIKTQKHKNESPVLVTILNPGSFFGELALIDQNNIRTASTVAMDKVTLIGFFKPDFFEILKRKPEMGVKILFQLALVIGKRLFETTQLISQLKLQLELAESDDKHAKK